MQFARVVVVDFNSVLRGKVIPLDRLPQNVRITDAFLGSAIDDSLPDSIRPKVLKIDLQTLDPEYLPDPSSFTTDDSDHHKCNGNGSIMHKHQSLAKFHHRVERIPWHRNHYLILGGLFDNQGLPFSMCPRRAACTALSTLTALGERMVCGFELEFVIRKDGEPYTASSTNMSYSMHDYDKAASFLDDVAENLQQMGIHIDALHREGFSGEFEIVLQHSEAMRATENAILAREVIRCTARRHGLVATFAPGLEGPGCRGHVHLSLEGHFGKEAILNDNDSKDFLVGADEIGQSFMAGVLHALPWLTFVVMGSMQGFRGAVPGGFIGVFKAWGINNRETPIRVASDWTNFEVRNGDSCANPFLVTAGIAVAGAIGIKRRMKLGRPCSGLPHEQQSSGLQYERLPRTMDEAIGAFERACATDKILSEVFPEDMVHVWTAIKRHETQYALKYGEEKLNELLSRSV